MTAARLILYTYTVHFNAVRFDLINSMILVCITKTVIHRISKVEDLPFVEVATSSMRCAQPTALTTKTKSKQITNISVMLKGKSKFNNLDFFSQYTYNFHSYMYIYIF